MSFPSRMVGTTECTPGYYNNEGRGWEDGVAAAVSYPLGPVAFFNYLHEWRESGDFTGIEFL